MKNWWIGTLLLFLLGVPFWAQAQSAEYQTGKVTCVKKLADSGGSNYGGTDSATKSDVHTYNVSIQVGDTVYVCRYQDATGELDTWLPDKDVQVRIKGKAIFVKRPVGKDAKGSIVKTTKAS